MNQDNAQRAAEADAADAALKEREARRGDGSKSASSGKSKMGAGWVLVLDTPEYREKYAKQLTFVLE
jgi:hypothetical protein